MMHKRWRAKKYSLRTFSGGRLVVVVRRFRTRAERRSARYQQWVFQPPFGNIREVSLQRHRAAPGRKKHASTPYIQFAPYILLISIGIAGAVFCTSQMQVKALEAPTQAISPPTTPTKPQPVVVPKSLPAADPTHISIPSQHISAPITPVGQASDGAIQMPPPLDWSAGWYNKSPTPGQLGPAIIVGHVDNYQNISVFWRLRYVQPGDKIYITRSDNQTATFTVTAIQQFDQSHFPTQAIYGNLPYAGLRLITCGGTFNQQTQSYTQNTVVFAKLE